MIFLLRFYFGITQKNHSAADAEANYYYLMEEIIIFLIDNGVKENKVSNLKKTFILLKCLKGFKISNKIT